jgi:hypothetical protein
MVNSGSERDPSRPVVRLLVDSNAVLVRGFKRVDLTERGSHGGYSRSIVDCLQPVSRIADIASVLVR